MIGAPTSRDAPAGEPSSPGVAKYGSGARGEAGVSVRRECGQGRAAERYDALLVALAHDPHDTRGEVHVVMTGAAGGSVRPQQPGGALTASHNGGNSYFFLSQLVFTGDMTGLANPNISRKVEIGVIVTADLIGDPLFDKTGERCSPVNLVDHDLEINGSSGLSI